jgi:hypothetical protein
MITGGFVTGLLAIAGGSLAIIKGIHEVVKTLTALIDLKLKIKELKKQDEEGK